MKDITELIIIIDKSGSMHHLQEDVVGGFNALIEEQKTHGENVVTTIFFNDRVDFVHQGVDINQIKTLEKKDYRPEGCTALLDAIGIAITRIKAKQQELKEEDRPKHTIFSIMTDGLENASKDYGYEDIKTMIAEQEKAGWTFLFQAANIDVKHEAMRLGIQECCARGFVADAGGVRYSMRCFSRAIDEAREERKSSKKK